MCSACGIRYALDSALHHHYHRVLELSAPSKLLVAGKMSAPVLRFTGGGHGKNLEGFDKFSVGWWWWFSLTYYNYRHCPVYVSLTCFPELDGVV